MLSRVLWFCCELLRNQWFKPTRLKRLQENRLKTILKHVYANVPLYHDKFDLVGIKPDNIATMDDLTKLPFITKQEVREGIPARSIARGYETKECIRVRTSGTTGGPMPIFWDQRFFDYCIANWDFRRLMAIGINRLDKFIEIHARGSPHSHLDVPGEKRKALWRYLFGSVVSSLQRRRRRIDVGDSAEEVIPDILEFQPKIIDGTLSYLRLIAEAMADKGIEIPNLKAVRSDGEVLDQFTRRFLESSFGCKVFDEYSTWDFGNGAWECKRREGYHIDADMLILEIVRDNEVVAPGERGEIVVTCLLNYAMPLIRYRTGDIGVLDEKMCSCGRSLPLLKSVEGRKVDCFSLANGGMVSPKVIMSAVQGTRGVSRYQVVQKSVDKVSIELMKRENEPEVSSEELMTRLRAILGEDVKIEVIVSGRKRLKVKFRPVISELTVSAEPRWVKTRNS